MLLNLICCWFQLVAVERCTPDVQTIQENLTKHAEASIRRFESIAKIRPVNNNWQLVSLLAYLSYRHGRRSYAFELLTAVEHLKSSCQPLLDSQIPTPESFRDFFHTCDGLTY